MSASILLVEDEEATSRLVAANLRGHGYVVRVAPSGEEALRQWEAQRPDVVLLDLGLPGIDGLAVIRRMRREALTPIIVLSAHDQERDKVEALDRGADDYLAKPIGMAELGARVRAALRRSLNPAADVEGSITVGPVTLDPVRRETRVAGTLVHLTPHEYELLKVLLSHVGRVVTRGRLLRAVWGEAYAEETHYLHVHVASLRHKLAAADPSGATAKLITAEPGVGYRIHEPPDPEWS